MSEENVELVRSLVEAWNRRDLDAFADLLHEEIEWHDRALFPDAGVHSGRRAVAAHMREVAANLDIEWKIDDVLDFGDHVLLAATLRGRGASSGAAFEDRVFATALVSDGKILRRQSYSSRAEALAAIEASRRVERIHAAHEALTRSGRFEAGFVSPDFELRQADSIVDTQGVFHGPTAFARVLAELQESFENLEFELEESRGAPGGEVVTVMKVRGRGRGSGIEIDNRVGWVWTFGEDGAVTRLVVHEDPADALDSVGLG